MQKWPHVGTMAKARKHGEVREWLNRAVSKTVEPLRVPWVRIPPSPPENSIFLLANKLLEVTYRDPGFPAKVHLR